ncbi:MAG: WG repeat-containing protein [Bacteroidales bacterium]|nr:WG repeat-containing protein [Bacteroidales bacterium]
MKRKSSSLNWIYAVFTSVIGLGLIITAYVYFLVPVYSNHFFSEKFGLHEYRGGRVQLFDAKTGKGFGPRMEKIFGAWENDSMTVFVLHDKRGYLSVNSGKIIVNPDYQYAWVFDPETNLAAVVKNDSLGFIDRTGLWKIKPFMKYVKEVNEGFDFRFDHEHCVIRLAKGKIGLINTEGKMVIPPLFAAIEHDDGCWRVYSEGLYGLYDSTFIVAYKTEYDYIDVLDKGVVCSKGDKQVFVRTSDLVEFPCFNGLGQEFDEYSDSDLDFSEEYSEIYVNNRIGILSNSTGKIIIPTQWDSVIVLSENVFAVSLDGYWFVVNKNNQMIQ